MPSRHRHHTLRLVSLVLAIVTTVMSMALPLYRAYERVYHGIAVHVGDNPDVGDMLLPLVLSTIMLTVGKNTRMYVGSIVCCTVYAYMLTRAVIYRILHVNRRWWISLSHRHNVAQCVLSLLSCCAMITVAIMHTRSGVTLSPISIIVTVCSTLSLYTLSHRGMELIQTWRENNGALAENEKNEFLFAIVLLLALTIPLVTLLSLHGRASPHVYKLSIALLFFTLALAAINYRRVMNPPRLLTSTNTWSPDTDYSVFILATVLLTSTIINRYTHRKSKRM